MRWPFVLLVLAALMLVPSIAHATWPDGELDREDRIAVGTHRAGASDLHGRSWFSLAAFEHVFADRRDVGLIAVVGIAFDRIAAGPTHAIGDHPTPPPPPPPEPPKPEPPRFPVDPLFARASVAAAWRASGVGGDDEKIDSIIARARQSAALPETRLRAMRLVDERDHVDATPTTGDTRYYDYAGANLWLEARLTWRLDRLLYADDEPTLERVRLERMEARAKIAGKVLDSLFQWQRALVDTRDAIPGSREELEARLRAIEAELTLDVLTAGWFTKARKIRGQ